MRAPASSPLWLDTTPAGDRRGSRAALAGDTSLDVAVVGGGFTGLWTAYYLAGLDPSRRIAVVEAGRVGDGASGRNGGWCSAMLPMSLDAVARAAGLPAARAMQEAMNETVDEVARITAQEGIDCHLAKGGHLNLARNEPQAQRLRAEVAHLHVLGFGDEQVRWLTAAEARALADATSVHGAAFTPHCAALHPARLVHGLAAAVERRGVTIHETTRATALRPHRVLTDRGTIEAQVVVRATEAFTARLPGMRREVAPIYSLMIATEPLPAAVFDAIGLRRRETFSDARRTVIYGQRTADDRIAFGGRGAPYHFASSVSAAHEQQPAVHESLRRTLRELFPAVGDAAITHRWGGAVAATRDWWCSAGFDAATGMAWAGGYVGDGVATSNLAGRTLAHLIAGVESPLCALPWVQHRSRRWEPEPLRWLGINAMVRLPEAVDRHEVRTGRRERWRTAILDRVLGH